jgi:hypothetical protein
MPIFDARKEKLTRELDFWRGWEVVLPVLAFKQTPLERSKNAQG